MDEGRLLMLEIARGAIEKYLGDVADPDDADGIFDEAYTIAFDALHDAGYPSNVCREVATEAAQPFAQP